MKKFLLSIVALCGLSTMAFAQATGSEDAPLSVDDLIDRGTPETPIADCYVQGYIVGWVDGAKFAEGAKFEVPATSNSNLILAGSSSERDLDYCIAVQLPSGDIRNALNLKACPENLGHEVILKGSNEKYFGVNGLKSVSYYKWVGKAPVHDPSLDPDYATGSEAKPLTVAEFLAMGTPDIPVANTWLKGIIVGSVDGMSLENAVIGVSSASKTNVLIAATANPASVSECVPLQLPAGDIRDAVNLLENPGNLGKTLTVCGSHEAYFGANALKSLVSFKLEGEDAPVTPGTGSIYKGLVNNADDWTFNDGTLPEGLSYVWSWKTYNDSGYLNASAYVGGTAYTVNAMSVSPVIDLTDATEASFSFDHAAKFQTTLRELCGLRVREAGTESWTELTIPTWPEAGAWTFVNSGDIDLKAYVGKKIEIAFVYGSSEAGADTWEIKNFTVKGDGSTVVPPTPGDKGIYSGLSDNSNDWTFNDGTLPEGLSYVWSWKTYNDSGYLNASAYVGGTAYTVEAYAISPVIDLSGYADCFVYFEHAAKFQTTLRELCGLRVREAGTESWTELTIPTWPEAGAWKFANSGDIDLKAYDGKKIELAFVYASSEAGADTWEIKNLVVKGSKVSGVEAIEAEEGEVEYYNLQGVKVANPEKGLYIRVQGKKATKIYVK